MPEDMIEYGKKVSPAAVSGRDYCRCAGSVFTCPAYHSVTALPEVIGVPCAWKNLEGMDSRRRLSRCPPAFRWLPPINGARNAGLLALRILGSH